MNSDKDTKVTINRPHRWDVPFGAEMNEADVDRVLHFPPFNSFDPERFPASSSLRDILLNDTRIQKFSKNDIVIREGDYGNSAFIVLSGSVKVFLSSLPQELLGRNKPKKASCALWLNSGTVPVKAKSPRLDPMLYVEILPHVKLETITESSSRMLLVCWKATAIQVLESARSLESSVL